MEKRVGRGEATRIFQERWQWLLRGQAAEMARHASCPVRTEEPVLTVTVM